MSTLSPSRPLTADASPLRRPLLKRSFDVTSSAIAIIVLSPVMAAIALAVRATSPGPALFRQHRVGLDGQHFTVLKFRTMVDGAEALSRETQGTSDPRITELGAFLRRTKLDELPQLFNVLVGDMSIVGPRPEIPYYADKYLPEDLVVLTVRPGITDPATLELADLDGFMESRGDSSPADFYVRVVQPRKLALQKTYIREQTFLGDIRIIMATLARIVRR